MGHPSDREACRALWRELTECHRTIYGDPSIGGDDPGLYFDEHLLAPGSLAPSCSGMPSSTEVRRPLREGNAVGRQMDRKGMTT